MQNFEKGVPFLVHLICEIFAQNIIKLSSKNSKKKEKNTILSYRAHASTVLSVLNLHLLVFVPYFITRSAPFAQIHKYSILWLSRN